MRRTADGSRLGGLGTAGLAVVTALLVWRPLLDLPLLGWDCFPLIAASRIASWSDVPATFARELMDGRYPLGRFWRPLVHLSFGLDHALWGLEPRGYHLTDLALLAACGALLVGISGRLFDGAPPARRLGGVAAGLTWVLHPVHYETLTAPARRADSLALLFGLWALFCHAREPRAPGPARRIGVALLCALALASKESGVAAVVVLGLCSACAGEGGAGGWASRVRPALAGTWTALLAVAVAFGLRAIALGGLGGYGDAAPWGALLAPGHLLVEQARGVLLPPAVFPGAPAAAVLAILLVVVAIVALACRRAREARFPGALGGGCDAVFLGLWALLLFAVTGLSGKVQGWYALPFVAVYALALGRLTERGVSALAARRPRGWLGVGASLAGLAVCAAGSIAGRDAADFRRAGELQATFLDRFERRVRDAAGVEKIAVEGCPSIVAVTRGGAPVREIFVLGPYSLEAWCELVLPERPVRVFFPRLRSSLERLPGELRVRVNPRTVNLEH